MKMHFSIMLAILLSHLSQIPALGDSFNYTSQVRSVSVSVHGPVEPGNSLTQSFAASDMSDFDQTADAAYANRSIGYATQHQHTTLLPESISISGSFDGKAPSFGGTGYAAGRTITDIHFDVTQDTSAFFSAHATVSAGDLSLFHITLTGPGADIRYGDGITHPFPQPLLDASQPVLLTPGAYRLFVDLDSNIHSFSQDWLKDFNIVLAVPEPTSACLLIPALILLRRKQ